MAHVSPFLQAVIGLGNPGRAYARTRHNLGFMVVDAMTREAQRVKKRTLDGVVQVRRVEWRDWEMYLVRPLTYMNLSGAGVRVAVQRYQWPLSRVLVVYDDVDLPLGRLRLRVTGSAGGHRGMASVLAALGTADIPRLRLGIGVEPRPDDLAAFVLAPFSSVEQPIVEDMIRRSLDVIACICAEGYERAMCLANVSRLDRV